MTRNRPTALAVAALTLALTACSTTPAPAAVTYHGRLGDMTAHLQLEPSPRLWLDDHGVASELTVWTPDAHLIASFWLGLVEYRLRLELDAAGCYAGTWGVLNPTWDPERGETALCPTDA